MGLFLQGEAFVTSIYVLIKIVLGFFRTNPLWEFKSGRWYVLEIQNFPSRFCLFKNHYFRVLTGFPKLLNRV